MLAVFALGGVYWELNRRDRWLDGSISPQFSRNVLQGVQITPKNGEMLDFGVICALRDGLSVQI